MKIVIFVNDSYFSYLLAKPLIEKYHNDIVMIIFSRRIKASKNKIFDIYRRTYLRYFMYRVFIELFARLNNIVGGKTIYGLSRKYNIPTSTSENVNDLACDFHDGDIAFSFNFDQIYKERTISRFPLGVLNIHSSKLPCDKGVSPALWAFARGDKEIWSTIYKIDSGIDSGDVYEQYAVPVIDKETFFSLYKRICFASGYKLIEVYENMVCSGVPPLKQGKLNESYNSWPDNLHKTEMIRNGKSFISICDMFRLK